MVCRLLYLTLIGFLKQNRKISRWDYIIGGHLGFLTKKVPISISFFFFVFQPFISKFCRNVLWELFLKTVFLVFHLFRFSFFFLIFENQGEKIPQKSIFWSLFKLFFQIWTFNRNFKNIDFNGNIQAYFVPNLESVLWKLSEE